MIWDPDKERRMYYKSKHKKEHSLAGKGSEYWWEAKRMGALRRLKIVEVGVNSP